MSSSNIKIQLLAHASFKVTTPEGRTLLVDPWFTNNPFMPPQLGWPEETDLILITHGHDDHLDTRIIDFIRRKQPKVIANPLVRWYLIEQGVPAHTFIGMNIGGTVSTPEELEKLTKDIDGLQIHVLKAGELYEG